MPYLINHARGSIAARFSHSDFDDIHLHLRLGGQVTEITECDDHCAPLSTRIVQTSSVECEMYMSSLECPFGDLVRFLEAVAIGVQECAYSWCAEGPGGEMRWQDAGDGGTLTVVWRSRHESFRYECSLEKRQLLEALYSSFRSFVESAEYQPLRYERLTEGEAFEVVLEDASAADLAAALAPLGAERVNAVVTKLESAMQAANLAASRVRFPLAYYLAGDEIAPCDEHDVLFAGWDALEPAQRLSRLQEFFGSARSGWFGANLRRLRSPIVEGWLAANA